MNTLFQQMLSALDDIKNGENVDGALGFLQTSVVALDGVNDLMYEHVATMPDVVRDIIQKKSDGKFGSMARAVHAFGHDCPDAIKDREQLLTDVNAQVLAADKHDGFYGDKLQQMVSEILGDNVKVHVVHGGLAELADIIFGDKEKPKFN